MKNFSLVFYLSGKDFDVVRGLQEELSAITGSRKSLDDWLPHITIGDAISVSKKELGVIEQELQNFSQNQKTFKVSAKKINGTEKWGGASGNITKYVIWIDIDESIELHKLFSNLKNEVTSKYNTWLPRIKDYNPHITLAFADLSKDGYEKGLKYLTGKEISLDLEISHIALVECFGEGNMKSCEYKRFDLSD